jgi:hypothetical protein
MGLGTTVFRNYREGDEAEILRTLNEKSDVACTMDEWAWLFPPEEDGRVIVVGERNGGVAAVCAGAPVRVSVDGREWAAVELRKLASSDHDDAGGVVDHFVETFGSDGRFALATAAFRSAATIRSGFVSAAKPRFSVLVREQAAAAPLGRLLYRAEPARDWEPRLDGLWRRARRSYPVAVVRDADRALRRFAAHPKIRHHRFIVCPRFSSRAVAFAVFAIVGVRCRWLDLLWDHDHPGALDLLALISGRLVRQFGGEGEELLLAGDDKARALLTKRGFGPDERTPPPIVAARSLIPELDATAFVERAYMTLADAEGLVS